MTTTKPSMKLATKVARHQRVIELLEHNEVQSQSQLLNLLAADGIDVTQATLSRDLDELRALKVHTESGVSVYAVPQDGGDPSPVHQTADSARARLERVVAELLSSTDHSANIVILRTPPGAAQYLASVIDHTTMPDIIGTVAGDDTVLEPAAIPGAVHELRNSSRTRPPGAVASRQQTRPIRHVQQNNPRRSCEPTRSTGVFRWS